MIDIVDSIDDEKGREICIIHYKNGCGAGGVNVDGRFCFISD